MKDPAKHQAAMQKILSRATSKIETKFLTWATELTLPIEHTGSGKIWIGRRNPDFRIVGQHKVIEVTMKECFIGRRKKRTIKGYAIPTIAHYRSKGWQCLVVFLKDHRCPIRQQLASAITQFAESDWSGVWRYDHLLRYED